MSSVTVDNKEEEKEKNESMNANTDNENDDENSNCTKEILDEEETKISPSEENSQEMEPEDKIAEEETNDKHVILSPTRRIRIFLKP